MSEKEIIYYQSAIMAEQQVKIAALEEKLKQSKSNEELWWKCYQEEQAKNAATKAQTQEAQGKQEIKSGLEGE